MEKKSKVESPDGEQVRSGFVEGRGVYWRGGGVWGKEGKMGGGVHVFIYFI